MLNNILLILSHKSDHVINGFRFRLNGVIQALNRKDREVAVAALQIAPRIIRFFAIGAVQEPGKLGILYRLDRSVMVARKRFRFSIADHIVDILICSPFRGSGIAQLAKRDQNVGIVNVIVMVHRLNLITLASHHLAEQVPHLLFVAGNGIAMGSGHRNFANAKGVAQFHCNFVCAGSPHKATHHERIAGMLTTYHDFARNTDPVHEGNFVTDAAQAAHVRFLPVRGSDCSSFFRLVRNQVFVAGNHVLELHRLAALDLGKAAKNATHEHIVQAVFNHNGSIVIHARKCRGLIGDSDTCKTDYAAHEHAVTSRGAINFFSTIHSRFDLRGNLDRRSIVHKAHVLCLGQASRPHDTAQVGVTMQAVNSRSRCRKRNGAFGSGILYTQEVGVRSASARARGAITDNAAGKVLVLARHLQYIGQVNVGVTIHNLERRVRFRRIKAHKAAHRDYISRRSVVDFTAKLAITENEFSGIGVCTERIRLEHRQHAEKATHRRTARNAGRQDSALCSDRFNDLQVFIGIANRLDKTRNTAQSGLVALTLVANVNPNRIVYKSIVVFARVTDNKTNQTAQEYVITSLTL